MPKKLAVDYSQRLIDSNDWATFLLVGCFVLFALTKYFYPRRFEEFSMLPITDKYFLVHGKNDAIGHPFNIMLFAVQVICVSIFAFLLFKVFNPTEIHENQWLFLQICTAYTVFVLIKFFVAKIVANIFSLDEIINEYLYQKLSYRNYLAIILFIGNLFFIYIYPPKVLPLTIFCLCILLLNAIALFYSYKKKGKLILGNFFYFILYLCALEISPYVILYKTLF